MWDVENKNIEGIVFNIQRMSIHDGPGIRTTVFLKGCPMNCLWCSNPESQKVQPEVASVENRCIGCGYCAKVCHKQIIEADHGYSVANISSCDQCMACVNECCMNAKKIVGRKYSSKELYEEIIKDKTFFDSSGGGVTFSGGEPFVQADFLIKMLEVCKSNGINTAIETTGMVDTRKMSDALGYLDQIFFDVKHMDCEVHKKLTDVSNQRVLENLSAISKKHANIIVRVPVIPGLNDSVNNIKKTADYVAGLSISMLELLPYHNYGENKYLQLGRKYSLSEIKAPTEEHMNYLAGEAAQVIGNRKTQVHIMRSM